MKIRMGFVSNSSSSSFCILGFSVTSDVLELVRKAAENTKMAKKRSSREHWCCSKCGFEPASQKVKFCEECGGQMETTARLEWDCDYKMFEAIGLSSYKETDSGWVAGIQIDDKRVGELVKIEEQIKTVLGDIDIRIMSGESYEG